MLVFLCFSILCNSDVSGSVTECHGLVLSVHLMELLKSSRKFVNLFTKTEKSTSNIGNIKCLEPIFSVLKVPVH